MKKAKIFAVGLCSALLVASVGAAKPDGDLPEESTESTDVAIEETEEDTEGSVIEDAFLPAEESVISELDSESEDELTNETDSTEETYEEVVIDEAVLTEEIVNETIETDVIEEVAPAFTVNKYDYESVQYASSETLPTYYLLDSYCVRTIPDPEAAVLISLEKGAEVIVLGTPMSSSPWIKISVNGQTGYINTFYLSANPIDASVDYSAELNTDVEAEELYAQWAF